MSETEYNDFRNDSTPDPLDALLREAEWPAAETERLERLNYQLRQFNTRYRGGWRGWGTAAAAVLAVATLGYYLAGRPGKEPAHHDRAIHRPSAGSPPEATGGNPAAIARASTEVTDSHEEKEPLSDSACTNLRPRGQGNTDSEKFQMNSDVLEKVHVAAFESRLCRGKPAIVRPLDTVLTEIIEQLVDDPLANLEQLAEPLAAEPRQAEWKLSGIIRLRNNSAPQRLAAARLLCHVATRRSYPLLAELRDWPPSHEAATLAMARLAEPQAFVQLIRAEPSPQLQQALMTELLNRNSEESVEVYLRFVRRPDSSQQALLALAQVKDPPLELLFAYLQDPLVKRRVAAACVLGHVQNKQITKRLTRMTGESQSMHEALVALSFSSDPAAVAFVDRAERNIHTRAFVRGARRRADAFSSQ